MLALSQLALSYGPSLAPAPAQARAQVRMETTADLKDLAKKLNPVVGYCEGHARLGAARLAPLRFF